MLVESEGYIVQQVFNCDETELLEEDAKEDLHH